MLVIAVLSLIALTRAALLVDIVEDGSGVTVTVSGTLDLDAGGSSTLTPVNVPTSTINPSTALFFGRTAAAGGLRYDLVPGGAAAWGAGGLSAPSNAATGTTNTFILDAGSNSILVPFGGGVTGFDLTSAFPGATLASLGITANTYNYQMVLVAGANGAIQVVARSAVPPGPMGNE